MPHSDTAQTDPIQLSVHSMPKANNGSPQRTLSGRLKMLLVWAVCAAPVVGSYLTYYVIQPQGRVNYGTLITPPKPLPSAGALPLVDLEGLALKAGSLKGQWLLVAVSGGACDHQCERQLYLQRQLRETLGREKDRLDRVWLITDEAQVRAGLLDGLKNAWVLRTGASELQRWLAPEAGQAMASHLYLVDPRGDWMMRFPVDADPSRVKKDLARLMKANESWDEPGR
jgi:hypothetical protein